MKNLQYWIRTQEVDGGIEYTLLTTTLEQPRPFHCEEISEYEYNIWKEKLNNIKDER